MRLMQAIKRMRLFPLLLLGMLVFTLTGPHEAQAAPPAFQAVSAVAAAANGNADPTVTLPAHLENDVLLLATIVRSGTATVATPAGWTQIGTPTVRAGTATYQFFWIRAGTTTVPNPLIDRTGTTGDVYARVINYRGAISVGDPWEVKGTAQTGTTDPSVFTGISTLTNDSLVVVAVAGEDNNNGSIVTTGTNPAAYTEHYAESGIGADGVITFSEAARTTLGATGNISVNWNTAIPVGFGGIVLALRPRGTVLGNGTDPGNTTLAPGGAATMADAFTFQTGTGTDVITAVVVGLSAGSSGGLSLVEITNDAGTTIYGSVTDPASDTPSITLSTNTLTATTTSAQYKIRVTPKSHAAMPAPPGSLYSVTAKINSWTSTGIQEGTDTAGTTVTIDNESSGDVTAASGASGDTQVVLNWANPTTPVETVAYSIVVLRSTAAVADTPVEGTTYAVGNTIGASTVRCVVTGLPPALTCTDTGLTNGTAYHYKIFTRDSNGNFSPGVVPTGSPFTPAANCYAVATANWNVTSTWAGSTPGGTPGTCAGPGNIPGISNQVFIGETATAYTVTIPTGYAANAAGVTIGNATSVNGAKALTLATNTASLTVAGSVSIYNPLNANTNALNVNAGTVTIGGNVALNGTSANNARIALINITTGTLTISGGLTYTAANAVRAVINMSTGGGTGVLNLAGALTVNNGANLGTLTAGTAGSTFNFNGTAAGQTIPIGVSGVIYNNLHVNNTGASGATLSAAISAANVTGNLRVQSGRLNNGGFAIVGGAGDAFEVANGARFNLTGTSAIPTGFTTRTFGATSTVNFGGGNQTVASGLTYGHLILDGGGTKTMQAGTTTIAGDFTLGTGTTRAATNNPTVNLAGNFSNSGTFNAGTGVFTFNGSAAQTITGVTTFGDVVFNNAAGVTANSDLSIVRNFTNTAGFNAGTTTTTFGGTVLQTLTGATTFYDLTFSNAAGFTLNNDMTASNALTLTNGVIATGINNVLFYDSTSSCSVTRTSGRVNGWLRKRFTVAQTTCDFEIGDATNYTPVTVDFRTPLGVSTVSTPGTVTAKATLGNTGGVHPQIATAPLDSTTPNLVNRYWMLTPGGGLTFSDVTLTFAPVAGDHDNTANVGNYTTQRYEISGGSCDTLDAGYTGAGSWIGTTETGIQTTTSIQATDISSFGSICSHFAIGVSSISGFLYEKEFIYTREIFY